MSDKYIWKYITRKEFQCPCCKRLPPDFYFEDGEEVYSTPELYIKFFSIFEEIRRRWGKPIRISSGYRCPPYNHKIKGELHSAHMFGLAMDLDMPSRKQVDDLSLRIEQGGFGLRMGIYRDKGTFVHIDMAYLIRPKLHPNWYEDRRWWK